MIRVLSICAALAATPTCAKNAGPSCLMAVVWRDGIVTIDWDCVEKVAASAGPQRAAAKALIAVRDGKSRAVVKVPNE